MKMGDGNLEKVVIVGAGPAGMFAAHELALKGKYDIKVLDKGLDIDSRPKSEVLCGMGGAGLYSDGKIIYDTKVGTFLPLIIGVPEVAALNDYVEDVFEGYGVHVKVLQGEDTKKLEALKTRSLRAGINFISARTAHVGTDKLVALIRQFRDDLIAKGVQFYTDEEVIRIHEDTNHIATTSGHHNYDHLVLAPGRKGSEWLEEVVCRDLGFEFGRDFIYNAVDIGVRVEVRREITDDVTDLTRDMKFYMEAGKGDRQVRTFCTCPGGKVAMERHGEYNLVNGHSEQGDPFENTNFAFLVSIPFTHPQANGNKIARLVARLTYELSDGQVLVQRFGDILRGRRSKDKRVNSWVTQPSLKEAVPGSIGMGMPEEYMGPIVDGLHKLGRVINGVDNEHTLLYSPEMKLHSVRILTDDHLQSHANNVYVAGDGPGLTRGIVSAAATGVLAARGIMRK